MINKYNFNGLNSSCKKEFSKATTQCCFDNRPVENNWWKLPYGYSEFTTLGETPSCAGWPLTYFDRNLDGSFKYKNGEKVAFNMLPPDFLYDFEGKELDKVKEVAKNLTEEQKFLATYWGKGVPQNQFFPLFLNLINAYGIEVVPASRMFSVLSSAISDSMIICWYYKYKFQIPRPVQYDPDFIPYLTTPKHPTYPAGHSVFAGCFEGIASYYFPSEKEKIHSLCEECSISRIYGGVHFMPDLDNGFALGLDIANKIINIIKNDSDLNSCNVNWITNKSLDADIDPKPDTEY
ncbi:vanadium-dependent haloperoxidase [Clostridium sp. B9]|uniref:vanadium-dependent haloperoxidase n=1 Tax=Clostridium sp. B9 TaxID=3423224 RepID=UPI003D2EFBBE